MLWAILWLLGNIFIAVNTMQRITSDHTCRDALTLPDTCYQATFSIFACFGAFLSMFQIAFQMQGICVIHSVYSFIEAKTPLWCEVATSTPAAEQCPWSPHIGEWSPPPPVWMRTWAREWKLQSSKLDSGITPSLEIIFNKFPKVADFDCIFQPGAGNWLKRVGGPNLCIPGCMKYDYGSTIWIAF